MSDQQHEVIVRRAELADAEGLVACSMRTSHRRGGIGARLVAQFSTWAKEVGAEPAEMTAYFSIAAQSVTLRTTL